MIVYTSALDITPGGERPEICLNQYDTDFALVFSLFSSVGTFEMATGTTAKIRGTKPDGEAYEADATIDGETGDITVDGDVQITAAAGKGAFEIALFNNGEQLSTINFTIRIERAALDKDTISSESVLRQFNDVYDRVDEIIAAGATYDQDVAQFEQTAQQAVAEAQAAADDAVASIGRVIDPTLTRSGKAADAAVTGGQLTEMQSEILALQNGGLAMVGEVVEEQVEEWMDEHPESHTTVEDNSLTDAKFAAAERAKKERKYASLAAAVSDAANLEAGRFVSVQGAAFTEYDGRDVVGKIVTQDHTAPSPFTEQLGSADLAIQPVLKYANAAPYNAATAEAIIRTALSYFDRNSLVYTPDGEPYASIFADSVGEYSGQNPIDCSTLAQAAIMGIRYEDSLFVSGNTENKQQPWGFKFPLGLPVSQAQAARTHGYTAAELAFYAALHGWLYLIDEGAGNVQPGDLVFHVNSDAEYADNFLTISHVQIVAGKRTQDDNVLIVVEAGSGEGDFNRYGNEVVRIAQTHAGNTYCKYGARFPLQVAATPAEDITSIGLRGMSYPYTLTGSPSGKSGTVYTKENFKAGELYTMIVRGDLKDLDTHYLFTRFAGIYGADLYNGTSLANGSCANDILSIVFTPLRDSATDTVVNAIKLCINGASGTKSVTIDDISIYKGLVTAAPERDDVTVTLASGVTAAPDTAGVIVRGHHVYMDVDVPFAAFGNVDVATVDVYAYTSRVLPVYEVNITNTSDQRDSAKSVGAWLQHTANKLQLHVASAGDTAFKSIRLRAEFDIYG